MEFIDLKQQYARHKDSIDAAIQRVLDHGQYILGPEVQALEARLAQFVRVKHCIALSNGTTALLAALMALDIGPGDEVITSPFSFFATAEMIVMLGAKPVYVDIDPKTYNIDPKGIDAVITPRTKLIMPVSLFGQCVEMDAILEIAARHQLPVIEDGAQSLGATYKNQQSCSMTTIACTSFFPSKTLGAYGEGGACFTNDDTLATRMRQIINQGQDRRYHHIRIGINGRFDSIQAAVLLAKLDFFEEELAQRQCVATWYADALAQVVPRPYIAPNCTSVYAQYTIRVSARDHVRTALSAMGIPTAVHYPVIIPKQPVMLAQFPTDQDYPYAQCAAAEVLSLPFHPYLTQDQVITIASALKKTLSTTVSVGV